MGCAFLYGELAVDRAVSRARKSPWFLDVDRGPARFPYIRTGTPEYIRIINRGTLRTFGQDPIYLSIAFAGFMSVVVYMAFLGVGWAFVKSQFSWLKKI